MKYFITFLLSSIILISSANNTIIIEGKYQGKNIYVQNPFSGTGIGFCVYQVYVNGDLSIDEVNSSAFQIDLEHFDLDIGDDVFIQIMHKGDCRPKVLSADLHSKPNFVIEDISLNEKGLLRWSAENVASDLPFIIEQFRWNKWIPIGEVGGEQLDENGHYEFKVSLHTGYNKVRLKQTNQNHPKYSKVVVIDNKKQKCQIERMNKKEVQFSDFTSYEIFDAYGNMVKKGHAQTIDVSALRKGVYYMNYDNTYEKFRL
ncbi:MAG: hypothetical protein MRY83_08400 [Flavobacteriales bacterium]|nr:hypothetical protein [Flavobacteriales bacterium]